MIIVRKQVTASGNRTRLMTCSDILSHPLQERCQDLLQGRPATLVIGGGHFGKRAAKILHQDAHARMPLVIVDPEENNLEEGIRPAIAWIRADGVQFLAASLRFLDRSTLIIPALPLHLAFYWLRTALGKEPRTRQIEVPRTIGDRVPHAWSGSDGALLVSHADFMCPEDCPEPADHCTVTGKRREAPLYAMLSRLVLPGYEVHILRSRQLAPGIGGYRVHDLEQLGEAVGRHGAGRHLVGTACRCHGVVSALEFCPGDQPPPSLRA